MKPGVGGLGRDFIISSTFCRSGVVPTWRELHCPSSGLFLPPSSVDEEPEAQGEMPGFTSECGGGLPGMKPEALIPESLSEGRISRIDG